MRTMRRCHGTRVARGTAVLWCWATVLRVSVPACGCTSLSTRHRLRSWCLHSEPHAVLASHGPVVSRPLHATDTRHSEHPLQHTSPGPSRTCRTAAAHLHYLPTELPPVCDAVQPPAPLRRPQLHAAQRVQCHYTVAPRHSQRAQAWGQGAVGGAGRREMVLERNSVGAGRKA